MELYLGYNCGDDMFEESTSFPYKLSKEEFISMFRGCISTCEAYIAKRGLTALTSTKVEAPVPNKSTKVKGTK